MCDSTAQFRQRVELLPVAARRLLCLIARQASHGPLKSKDPGIATMPELHEACGLEVDSMHSLLTLLQEAGLITIAGEYPFEEVRPAAWTPLDSILKRCEDSGTPIEAVVVDLRFDLVAGAD